jgi:hypothetical protein
MNDCPAIKPVVLKTAFFVEKKQADPESIIRPIKPQKFKK